MQSNLLLVQHDTLLTFGLTQLNSRQIGIVYATCKTWKGAIDSGWTGTVVISNRTPTTTSQPRSSPMVRSGGAETGSCTGEGTARPGSMQTVHSFGTKTGSYTGEGTFRPRSIQTALSIGTKAGSCTGTGTARSGSI